MSVPNIKDQFVVKDSGERHQFESGMVRDTQSGKLEWDRIFDGPMAERWATLLTKAITKYADVEPGKPNWTLASGDAERIRFRKSAVRHFMQWLRGDTDEDHGAAVFFNINGFEYVKTKQAAPGPTEFAKMLYSDRKVPDSEIKLEEKPLDRRYECETCGSSPVTRAHNCPPFAQLKELTPLPDVMWRCIGCGERYTNPRLHQCDFINAHQRMCASCNEFRQVDDYCIRCGNCNHCCTEL